MRLLVDQKSNFSNKPDTYITTQTILTLIGRIDLMNILGLINLTTRINPDSLNKPRNEPNQATFFYFHSF